MPKTIKTALFIIQQRVKIYMLRNKIKKMERTFYLNVYERMELRDAMRLLQSLEEQQRAIDNTTLIPTH